MSDVNRIRPRLEKEYQHILEDLKDKGIRITETRKAVLAYMMNSHEHPSAEKIYQDLRQTYPSMSLATVYNNLKVLVEEGYVTELKISKDQTTYYDFMGHQHLNVVCESCGNIADVDVDLPDLRSEAAEGTGYQITKMQILIYGMCPDCQNKKGS